MRRIIASCLGLLLGLGACNSHPAATSTSHRSAKPSTNPTAVATGAESAQPTPQLSEGPTIALKGVVRLDAAYLVAARAGKLVSDAGAEYIAANGGTLLGDAGGGLLSDQGAELLRDQGGGILSNNSAGLIGNNGSGLIANNGSNLIGNNGSGIGGPTTTRFHLLNNADLTPVSGMAIVPVDLAAGQILGRVFYTDKTGNFTVRLPQELAGNVALSALIPAQSPDDPTLTDTRLNFSLIVPASENSTAVVDEDTAVVASYLRTCFAGRLMVAFGSDDFEQTLKLIAGAKAVSDPLKGIVYGLAQELRKHARDAQVDALPLEARERLSRRVSAAILSHVDLTNVKLDKALSPAWNGPAEPAMDALTGIMNILRMRAAELLAANPNAFDSKPYLKGYTIKRPSDLGDFIVKAYLNSEDTNAIIKTGVVMADVGARIDPVTKLNQEERLRAAYYNVVNAIGQTLVLDEKARSDAYAIIDAAKPH